MQIYSVLWT